MPEHFSPADCAFMAEALSLAEQGLLTTTPNPRVGCVLVKEGVIVGRGWHARAGEAHAEIHALAAAGEAARGATAYVTLEPCSHYGRTPPCVEALVRAGVARVVAAMTDPNPQVAGSGLARLRAAGIHVASGLLEAEARELNLGFISRMTRGRPWVRLKSAASLDGRTALSTGESQWITGAAARRDGHHFRARACALLTGMGTVRHDDPQLSVREVATPRQPWRVVVDSRLELSASARLLADGVPVLVVFAQDDPSRRAALVAVGAECLCLPGADGRVDLAALMAELGRRGVNELHVEAGSRLNGALLQAGLADELLLYLAPCLLGDAAQGLFSLPQPRTLAERLNFRLHDVVPVGEDVRLRLRAGE
ncbi:MAG: bifunctional diaminohydroxyphosphoribosylaminopyrimidine deaminase/5-amino-6-(5-phosphoribosylamino)uracil reductase RibD [Zoogloeaceae bacterium]|jgi:diaminohydroxyphosphoribosylaminopyrimidine deaminase/5-amino-6-(5-phosphoribosylamino)uracil reductase|nr:bifunctional diaminohydroxyphosphoribosylaminopyrimidine deaminase/5-amino-6-(5-phosphoribosylamino)uracil reductase RibD [Zoogloeaceae bacterium]